MRMMEFKIDAASCTVGDDILKKYPCLGKYRFSYR